MAPFNKFQSSHFKNITINLNKKENYFTELQINNNNNSNNNSIKSTPNYSLTQSNTSGHLICLPYDQVGNKFNFKAPTIQVAPGIITEFNISRFGDLIAAGSEDGRVYVSTLPSIESIQSSTSTTNFTPLLTFTSPSGRSIDTLNFHPTTSGLLLSTAQNILEVHNVESLSPTAIFSIVTPSPIWSSQWSLDGKYISTTSKDGILRLYDVRSNPTTSVMETATHAGTKSSQHVWLTNDHIFTTGFSKMRDREYSLYDIKNFNSSIKTTRIDSGTGILIPVADIERGMVYFAGKGDMTLRWAELNVASTFTEGASPLPLPISSLTLIPPPHLNLMQAEINRLLILSPPTSTIIPISITVPRRQYLDFHSELFPSFRGFESVQNGIEWLEGGNEELNLVRQDPSIKEVKFGIKVGGGGSSGGEKKVESKEVESTPVEVVTSKLSNTNITPSTTSTPVESHPTPSVISPQATPIVSTPIVSPTPTQLPPPIVKSTPVLSQPTVSPSPITPSPALSSSAISSPTSTSTSTPPPSTIVTSTATTTALSTKERFNPNWSRKFIQGKTSLKPKYHGMNNQLNSALSNEVLMLKSNAHFLFFPLSGPGGRLAYHSLSTLYSHPTETERFPTQISALISGSNLVEFELDPFNDFKLFIGGEDGRIRVFNLPESETGKGDGGDILDIEKVLGDEKMAKILELKHHPIVANLLLSISDDFGNSTLRLWDIELGIVLKKIEIGIPISSIAWSPDGKLLALATKSKTLLILDPRSDTPFISCSTHDSIRPVKLIWSDHSQLITTGFSKSAMREINLYSITSSTTTTDSPSMEVNKISSQTLDASPGPLFPFIDLDTNILFLYAKGERSLHLFELSPTNSNISNSNSMISRLPSFEHGTLQIGFSFMNKFQNDIKGIEVIKCLRLTKDTIELVGFTVPRAKVQFFQDDIFIPTRDTTTSTLTIKEWMKGINKPLNLINLRPEGLGLLSEAPATVTKGSTRSQITGPILTESQIQEAYMTRMFDAAKVDEEEVELVRSINAVVQEDDDW